MSLETTHMYAPCNNCQQCTQFKEVFRPLIEILHSYKRSCMWKHEKNSELTCQLMFYTLKRYRLEITYIYDLYNKINSVRN